MNLDYNKADIESYRHTREELGAVNTRGWLKADKALLDGMRRDCDYTIEWLEKGRRPGNKRGVERLAAYQREIPFELMERYANPPPRAVIRTENGANMEYLHMEYILSLLSERERECYEFKIGGLHTEREIADIIGVTRTSVQEFLKRAQTKINKYKSQPMPLKLLLDDVV